MNFRPYVSPSLSGTFIGSFKLHLGSSFRPHHPLNLLIRVKSQNCSFLATLLIRYIMKRGGGSGRPYSRPLLISAGLVVCSFHVIVTSLICLGMTMVIEARACIWGRLIGCNHGCSRWISAPAGAVPLSWTAELVDPGLAALFSLTGRLLRHAIGRKYLHVQGALRQLGVKGGVLPSSALQVLCTTASAMSAVVFLF